MGTNGTVLVYLLNNNGLLTCLVVILEYTDINVAQNCIKLAQNCISLILAHFVPILRLDIGFFDYPLCGFSSFGIY